MTFRRWHTKRAGDLKVGDKVRRHGRIVAVSDVWNERHTIGVLFARRNGYHYYNREVWVDYR